MGYREDYDEKYGPMRAAATKVEGDMLRRLIKKCQENPWLKVGGVDFADDMCMESDYSYYLEKYEDPTMLKMFFMHGNWSIRAAVMYKDLIFVNQVNGGDEWWTIKVTDTDMVAFESLSCRRIVEGERFDDLLNRMHEATPEQCKALNY
jgi:hypothetical protein